jgi:hypothetical protein
VGLDEGPLLSGEVAGVVVGFHTRSTSLGPQLFPLWDSLSAEGGNFFWLMGSDWEWLFPSVQSKIHS